MLSPTFYFKISSPCIFFSSKICTCARDATSPGTIMWISALIAQLRFVNGVCSNNYMGRVRTDTNKRKKTSLLWIIAVIFQASQKLVFCCWAREDSETLTLLSQTGELSILWKELQGARMGHTEHLQLHFKQRRGFGALHLQEHQGASDSSHSTQEQPCPHTRRDRAVTPSLLPDFSGRNPTQKCFCQNYWSLQAAEHKFVHSYQ